MLGYVRITVEGYYIERFINICTTSKILIWNLKREKGVKLNLSVGIQDYYKAVKVAKKLKCKVKIVKKRGIPFIINKYKKRKIFIIALVIILITLYASSNYIWNIDIQVEDNLELESEILDTDVKRNDVCEDLSSNILSSKEEYVTYKVHIIRNDETIDMIKEKYNITKEELEKYNSLDNIVIGSKIIIPIKDE